MEALSYTISRFCEATGLGRSRVYQLLAAGELRAVRCGARTLIPADEATRFVASLPPAYFAMPPSLAKARRTTVTRA
jgi:excisionase family DNA binding protein